MLRGRRLVLLLAAVVVLLLAATGTGAYFALNAQAQGGASVVVFVGTLSLQRSGANSFAPAHTGDQVRGGDRLRTGPASRAAVEFPDGSTARMDAQSELVISAITKSGKGWNVALQQGAGKTWNRVVQLAGGNSYRVTAPNNTASEVRGTDFLVIYDDVAKVVRVDAFVGSVSVTARGKTLSLAQGQSTTVAVNQPPANPVPIPAGDLTDPFTVFNQSTGFSRLNQGQSTGLLAGGTGDGISDLTFTLGWPGSSLELAVFKPDGTEYQHVAADQPPAQIQVTAAQAGEWKYRVTDVKSKPGEYWWVTVSKTTPAWRGTWSGNYSGRLNIGCAVSGPISFQITEQGQKADLNVHITGSQRQSGSCAVIGDEDYEFTATVTADKLTGAGGVDVQMTKTGPNAADGSINGSGGSANFSITRTAG